jgi:hypothetical protein
MINLEALKFSLSQQTVHHALAVIDAHRKVGVAPSKFPLPTEKHRASHSCDITLDALHLVHWVNGTVSSESNEALNPAAE